MWTLFLVTSANLTENYHAGGTVAVLAKSLQGAKKLLNNPHVTDAEWAMAERFQLNPEVGWTERVVGTYPNAGCC